MASHQIFTDVSLYEVPTGTEDFSETQENKRPFKMYREKGNFIEQETLKITVLL